jgi:hypothetical protein
MIAGKSKVSPVIILSEAPKPVGAGSIMGLGASGLVLVWWDHHILGNLPEKAKGWPLIFWGDALTMEELWIEWLREVFWITPDCQIFAHKFSVGKLQFFTYRC